MAEKKTRQYLLYAIGEILLVVIGILIALSINNWNEGNKKQASELAILKEIRSGLKRDSSEINRSIFTLKLVENGIKQSQKYLDGQAVNSDSVGYNFGWTLFSSELELSIVPYENLKAKGVDLISSSDTRASLISYYESSQDFAQEASGGSFMNFDDFRRQSALHFDNIAFFDDISKNKASIRSILPQDSRLLRQDKLYRTYLNTRLADIETMIYFTFEEVRERIEKVKEIVNHQIKTLE